MDWVWRKLDVFIGAVVVAVSGVAASQAHVFLTRYVQKLGGRLDEAKAHLNNVQNGLRYRLMGDSVRSELEAEARRRLVEVQDVYHAVVDTNALLKPISFLRRSDATMLSSTWHDFIPALPVSAEGMVYTGAGMILGFLAYETIKLPVVMLLLEPRRRKFRRRG